MTNFDIEIKENREDAIIALGQYYEKNSYSCEACKIKSYCAILKARAGGMRCATVWENWLESEAKNE